MPLGAGEMSLHTQQAALRCTCVSFLLSKVENGAGRAGGGERGRKGVGVEKGAGRACGGGGWGRKSVEVEKGAKQVHALSGSLGRC